MAEKELVVKPVKPLKRKLHVNWDVRLSVWQVKKAFNFVPVREIYTAEQLADFLKENPDVEIVARYT